MSDRDVEEEAREIAAFLIKDLTHYRNGCTYEDRDREEITKALLAFAALSRPDIDKAIADEREAIAAMADEWAAGNRAEQRKAAKRENLRGVAGYDPPEMSAELDACVKECEAFAAAIRARGGHDEI